MSCRKLYCVASATSQSLGIAWAASYLFLVMGKKKACYISLESWICRILTIIFKEPFNRLWMLIFFWQRRLKGCGELSIVKLPLNKRALRTSLYVMKHEEETFIKGQTDKVQSAMSYMSVDSSGLLQQRKCAAQGWPQAKKLFLKRSN